MYMTYLSKMETYLGICGEFKNEHGDTGKGRI